MSNWRYAVHHDTVNNHTTITRGRHYTPRDRGWDTSEDWTNYWDGDSMCAFYDEGWQGLRVVTGTDEEMGNRAKQAFLWERAGDYTGTDGALDRVAQRITDNIEARFIVVHLERGMDLHVLSWDGDPENTWRDEIESVWHGEVYRCEVEEYYVTAEGGFWAAAEDLCEEWYGEDNADAGLAKEFPLTEFPAELLVSATD